MSFVEDQISGFQLVQRSGVEYQAQQFGSMGEAICQLDDEPQPVPSNCLGTGAYWQYFHRAPAGWNQSLVGASSWMLHDGDMDGWRYSGAAGQPPSVTFAWVCNAPANAPTTAAPHTAAPAAVAPTAATRGPSITVAPTPPTPSPSASLEALAPTVTPTARAALAVTAPSAHGPPPPSSTATWLLLLFGTTMLVGLGAINLLRRGP